MIYHNRILNIYYFYKNISVSKEKTKFLIKNMFRLFRSILTTYNEVIKTYHKPIPINYYERSINFLLKDKICSFISIKDVINLKGDPERINIYLRHDLDKSPENVKLLCRIDKKYDLIESTAIYVIVLGKDEHRGGCDYVINGEIDDSLRHLLLELKDSGFEIGLHSIAWASSNFDEIFNLEINRFKSLLGFYPKTFTFHGFLPPKQTKNLRCKFVRWFNKSKYRSRIKHLDIGRVILSDSGNYPWIHPPLLDYYFLGELTFILTHPNNWYK